MVLDPTRGFLVLAQNNQTADYVRQARVLARSIQRSHETPPGVAVVVDQAVDPAGDFEYVIPLAADDAAGAAWKIHNKWRLWELSPYEETLWLDADMVIPRDMSRWWSRLSSWPIRFCSRPVDDKGQTIDRGQYRERWVRHGLPMLYTGMVYFKRSREARRVFEEARRVMAAWPEALDEHGMDRWRLSGDRAFALAVKNLGYDWAVPEIDDFFRFVHMKPHAFRQPRPISHDWTETWPLTTDGGEIRIGGRPQRHPVHYVRKELVSLLEQAYLPA